MMSHTDGKVDSMESMTLERRQRWAAGKIRKAVRRARRTGHPETALVSIKALEELVGPVSDMEEADGDD